MRKRERLLEKINVELAEAAANEGVSVPEVARVGVRDKGLNRKYDRNAQRITEAANAANTPVRGMDAKRIKRLQKLSKQLGREEDAIVRERQRVVDGFDRVEEIDYTKRGRRDLYEADRRERDRFVRDANLDPTDENRTALEVGRMGKRGIGAAVKSEAELEALLREREDLTNKMQKQHDREAAADERAAARRAKRSASPDSSSRDDDRDVTGGTTSGTTPSTSGSTSTSGTTPAGPTKKELRAAKKAEKTKQREEKKRKRTAKKKTPVSTTTGVADTSTTVGVADTSTTTVKTPSAAEQRKEARRRKREAAAEERDLSREERAARKQYKKEKKQTTKAANEEAALIAKEIKDNQSKIDRALVSSGTCKEFWDKLDRIGLSGRTAMRIKETIGPLTFNDEKLQAQSRVNKELQAEAEARQKRINSQLKFMMLKLHLRKLLLIR